MLLYLFGLTYEHMKNKQALYCSSPSFACQAIGMVHFISALLNAT
jgi:hypothetical protein